MLHTQHYVHMLTYPFRGENAVGKFAIACVVVAAGYLVPVLPWILFMGYIYLVMQTIVHGGDAFMPVWTEWGRLFRNGSKLFGVLFVYTLPVNLVFFGGFFVYFVSMFAFALAAENNSNSGAPLVIAFIPFIFLMVMAIGYVLLLVTGLILPLASGNTAAKDRFTAGFEWVRMWQVFKTNTGGFLVAFLLAIGILAFVILVTQVMYMTIVFCFLLPFAFVLLSVYAALVIAALFADAYRVGMEKLTIA
jgi:hypothetical protein